MGAAARAGFHQWETRPGPAYGLSHHSVDRGDGAGLRLWLSAQDGNEQATSHPVPAWRRTHARIHCFAVDKLVRRSATLAGLSDGLDDGNVILESPEVSAVVAVSVDDYRPRHHAVAFAREGEESGWTVGDRLWARADVLLRPARLRGACGCRRDGAGGAQASALDATLVFWDDSRELWIPAVGGLCDMDRDHRRAVSGVPLVRGVEEAAQGLVAGVPVRIIPTRWFRGASRSRRRPRG